MQADSTVAPSEAVAEAVVNIVTASAAAAAAAECAPSANEETSTPPKLVTPWQNKVAKAGDLLVLWSGHSDVTQVLLQPGGRTHIRFGNFLHDSLIGQPYGSRIYPDHRAGGKRKASGPCRSNTFMLTPTPELWSRALNHRTAILYPSDCGMIVYHLNLKPGSWVAESGTGSGSLSTAIARVIAPTGHLHTFEFNQGRAESARVDFKKLGTDKCITVHHRDVCKEGFAVDGVVGSSSGGGDGGDDGSGGGGRLYDAVFLDLPSPWVAIHKAHTVLRTGGRVCSFSPCIEQVQRACIALRQLGFTDIRTYECLLREIQVQVDKAMLPPPRVVDRTPRHLRVVKSTKDSSADDAASGVAVPEEEEAANPTHAAAQPPVKPTARPQLPKRARHLQSQQEDGSVLVRPFAEMPSHTGYLTFATRGI
jgi:tRNA (adenine57-N1/adenine58-N1)-methyltransferase